MADYGSYRVFIVDRTIAESLKGRANLEIRDDYDRIFLNAGAIDTTQATRGRVAPFAGKRLHLVQFAGHVRDHLNSAALQCLKPGGLNGPGKLH